jgi:protein TonB
MRVADFFITKPFKMNTILMIVSSLLFGFNPYPEPDNFTSPSFPGGEPAMSAHFRSYLEYPMSERENGIEGTVLVAFIIERDGLVTSPEIVEGLTPGCDAAARDAVVLMPKWKPARLNGELVRCRTGVRVRFDLN